MSGIFSKDQVNTGRQLEIDIFKGICILLMVLIHVIENRFPEAVEIPFFGGLYISQKIVGATGFMFCMGCSIPYSKQSDSTSCLNRGVWLLTVGMILNFFRYFIVPIPSYIFDGDLDGIMRAGQFFSDDILQFAGLAFLLLGLLKKFKLSSTVILVIAILLNISTYFLNGVQTGIFVIDQFLGLFWGTYTESLFILFAWFVVVAVGIKFGEMYRHLENKDKFYRIVLPVSLVLFVLITIWATSPKNTVITVLSGEITAGYWLTIFDIIYCMIGCVLYLSIFWLFARFVKIKYRLLSYSSKHINEIYCVSWVWIVYSIVFTYQMDIETTCLSVLLYSAIMYVVTWLTLKFHYRFTKSVFDKFLAKHRKGFIITVWVISICLIVWLYSFDVEHPSIFNGYLHNLIA